MRRERFVCLTFGALAVSLVVAVPTFAADGHFDRTLQVSGEADVDVVTGAGNIQVTRGNGGTVHVVAQIKASRNSNGLSAEEKVRMLEANPPVEQNGKTIRIGHISDERLRQNVSINYEITVPEQTRLRAQSGSGDEKVEGIAGPVRTGTGSGNVAVHNIGGEVNAETGSGNMDLADLRGGVRATSGSGNIHATGLAGAFAGNTGSGDVHVGQSSLTDVKLQTGSGNVKVDQVKGAVTATTGSGDIDISGTQTALWKLEAGSGTVRVHLPSDAVFDLHARTGSGGIYSEHQVTFTGQMRRLEMRGTVRGGGSLLDVSTGSGSIYIQ